MKHKLPVIISAVAFVVLILDQASKWYMTLHPNLYRTEGLFELFMTTNTGIAFSIPLNGMLLYALIAVIAGVMIVQGRHHLNLGHPLTAVMLGLIIGGGLGNIIDRIRLGHVIDFIKVGPWPMFNLADSAITIAAFILIFWQGLVLRKQPKTAS